MKTFMPNQDKAHSERKWFVVDLANEVLGRHATQIAHILRGKHKPEYTPFLDCGDNIIVINADKVRLTGNKLEGKLYSRFTGYPGGLRQVKASVLLASKPEELIQRAVKGMLPHGPLGRAMLDKLHIYPGSAHPHQAQKPSPLKLK